MSDGGTQKPLKSRSLWVLLFPIFGMVTAWLFRPSEKDWSTLQVRQPPRIVKPSLTLPDGQALRFIQIPDQPFALSVLEVPPSILALYHGETASHAGASAFATWLSQEIGQNLRLPTVDEWQLAARGGINNAEFVWGFGPAIAPEGIYFADTQPPSKTGKAFGYGFRDLTGGKWEWTQTGKLIGSAWSEQNPETLYIDYVLEPTENYQGADTAIRLLWLLSPSN